MPEATDERGFLRPGLGPTLPARLARRGIAPWVTVAVAVALLVAVVAATVVRGDPLDGRTQYIHRGTPVFNLLYGGGLARAPVAGDELVRLTGRRGGAQVQLTVRPFRLPPFRGDVNGALPIAMTNLAASYDLPQLRVIGDGKGRISDAPGYQNEFTYRVGDRRGYGLDVLVVAPLQPRTRDGLLVSLRQLRDGAQRPAPAGRMLTAAARSSLRSLRFGTALTYPDRDVPTASR